MSRCPCGKESCNEDCAATSRFAFEREQHQRGVDDPPPTKPRPGEPVTEPTDEPAITEPAAD